MIFIKEYKGFGIHFDESDEKFSASGNRFDTHFVKTSIAGVKKAINEFIKENVDFGEFKIQEKSISYSNKIPEVFTVIGVTSDKRLRYRDGAGQIHTLSKYNLDKFILYKDSNQEVFKEQSKIGEERDKVSREYDAKIKKLNEKLETTTLGEFIKSEGLDIKTNRY